MRDKKAMSPGNDVVHTVESWCVPSFQDAKKIGDGIMNPGGRPVPVSAISGT